MCDGFESSVGEFVYLNINLKRFSVRHVFFCFARYDYDRPIPLPILGANVQYQNRQPRREVTACTQPFFNVGLLEGVYPGFVEKWIRYHVEVVGVGRFDMYDSDATLWEYVKPLIKEGLVRYKALVRLVCFLSTI